MLLGKGALKLCSNFTGELPCRGAISIKLQSNLQSNFIEITLSHGCSPVDLMYIFRTPFPKNNSEGCFWFILCVFKKAMIQTRMKTFPNMSDDIIILISLYIVSYKYFSVRNAKIVDHYSIQILYYSYHTKTSMKSYTIFFK